VKLLNRAEVLVLWLLSACSRSYAMTLHTSSLSVLLDFNLIISCSAVPVWRVQQRHRHISYHPSVILYLMLLLSQVMQMHLTGCWSAGQVKEGLELAMGGCQQLRGLMRQTLIDAAADDDEEAEAAGDDAMQEG
jgi:hypothetical protein